MSKACDAWQTEILDAGLIPEGLVSDVSQKHAPFEWKQDKANYPFSDVLEMAKLAGEGKAENLSRLQAGLENGNAVIRFWATMGCVNLGEAAKPAAGELTTLLKDDVADVRVNAAEALVLIGQEKQGLDALIKEAPGTNEWAAVRALNALDELGEATRPVIPALKQIMQSDQKNKYIPRTANHILNKLLGTENRVK